MNVHIVIQLPWPDGSGTASVVAAFWSEQAAYALVGKLYTESPETQQPLQVFSIAPLDG